MLWSGFVPTQGVNASSMDGLPPHRWAKTTSFAFGTNLSHMVLEMTQGIDHPGNPAAVHRIGLGLFVKQTIVAVMGNVGIGLGCDPVDRRQYLSARGKLIGGGILALDAAQLPVEAVGR